MNARPLRPIWTWLLVLVSGCGSSAALAPRDGGGDTAASAVTFRLVIPDDRTFCEQSTGCAGPERVSVLTAAGQPVLTAIPWCSTLCSTACQPSPCPGIACVSQGLAVKTAEYHWDGSSYAVSTCGNQMTCYRPETARPGHYVAHMCATPGTLAAADGGVSNCVHGPAECIDVPFDLPAPGVVVGTLP